MITTAQPQGSRLARLLDVVTLIRAIRQGFAGLGAGTSLLFFALSGLASIALGVMVWEYDLKSTWNFVQGIRYDTAATAQQVVEYAATVQQQQGPADLALASLIGAFIGVGITFIPTIVELIAPRVMHPTAQLLLQGFTGFDFITDWGRGWAAADGWSALDFAKQGTILRGAVNIAPAFLVTLVISICLQVAWVMAVTICMVCALNLVGLGGRAAQGPTIEIKQG